MINRRGRPKWAVGYLRVSTHRQVENGIGLELQREHIRAYAIENGYRLEQFYKDIASGNDKRSMMDRPEFSDAVLEAKRLHGTIIVARLDRVSRNEKKFLEFCGQEKIRIVSAVPGETEDFQRMVKTVARGEQVRRSISVGTKRALSGKKARGMALGNPATTLKANRASAKSRATASQMKALEIRDYLLRHAELRGQSYALTADALNVAGIRTTRGLAWNKASVRRMLRTTRQEIELYEEPDYDF
ncbi:MAG: recombinase family protein [Paracoccaceae bacterium]